MIFALFILILLGIILNELSKKYSLYKLTYSRNISKRAVEINEEFEMTTIVENNKILPVSFLQIAEKLPSQLSFSFKTEKATSTYFIHNTTMFLMPKQRVKRTYRASFNKRGVYFLSNVALTAGDFLGTETVSIQKEYGEEIIVYPKTANLDTEIKPHGSYYGDISVQRWIINDPVLTIGIREYTSLDPQKNIHWPSSLKTGRLMVKNYDFTTDNRVIIVLNIECSKPFWSTIEAAKIERCISITRGIIEKLEELGVPYGFSSNIQAIELNSNKSTIPYSTGAAHFYNILELLGRASYGISKGYEELLFDLTKIQEKSITYILITPNVLEEYFDAINRIGIEASRTILISMTEENLDFLNEKIITYVGSEN